MLHVLMCLPMGDADHGNDANDRMARRYDFTSFAASRWSTFRVDSVFDVYGVR